jgi:hypothetical protein
LFHSNLNQDNWESGNFQFYAGDLYDAIPILTKRFYPSEKLIGSCVALQPGLNLTKGGFDFFNVTMNFQCDIGTQKQKIVDFNVAAVFLVQGVPKAKSIDFVIKDAEFSATYNQYQDYKV